MLRLRPFEPADRDAVIRLLGGGRAPDYGRRKTAIFDWQYFQNPHDDGSLPLIIGTLDGEIIAVNGFMPNRILFRGRPARGCWGPDTCVAEEHRGKGFGKTRRRAVAARAPVMLGYGISDLSDRVTAKFDWHLHEGVRPLHLSVSEPGLRGAAKNLWTRIARARHSAHRPWPVPVARDDAAEFGAEVDDLWRRSAGGYRSVVERDAAYLNWKYRRHPVHRYASYSAREDGRLRGLLIARHHPVESVLVDYCGPADDGDLMHGLAQAAIADLLGRGTVHVRCETTYRPMVRALEGLGMHAARRASRFRVRGEGTPAAVLRDWFLMPGDSDGDLSPPSDPRSSSTSGAARRPGSTTW